MITYYDNYKLWYLGWMNKTLENATKENGRLSFVGELRDSIRHHVYKRLGVIFIEMGGGQELGRWRKLDPEDISNSWMWWLSQYCGIMCVITLFCIRPQKWLLKRMQKSHRSTHVRERAFLHISFSFRRHFNMAYHMYSGTRSLWIASNHRSHVSLNCEKVWIWKCKNRISLAHWGA